jgi:hypothetical protein
MPYLDPFDNNQYMRKMIVAPAEATDEDLASFIAPYIVVDVQRRELSSILFWYSGDYETEEVRARIDAWERENDRRRHERWRAEHEAKWAKKLAEIDLTEPEPDAFWKARGER